VGTGDGPHEKLGPAFDTPSLLSLYKTAPYLHDGSATNLMDVLITTANLEDRHGATRRLTERELQNLVAFLQSLPRD
jgi:cytochrome c peroxidase